MLQLLQKCIRQQNNCIESDRAGKKAADHFPLRREMHENLIAILTLFLSVSVDSKAAFSCGKQSTVVLIKPQQK